MQINRSTDRRTNLKQYVTGHLILGQKEIKKGGVGTLYLNIVIKQSINKNKYNSVQMYVWVFGWF